MKKKKFNPDYMVAFSLIGLTGFLIYFKFINNKVGGIFLIVCGILMYVVTYLRDKRKVSK